MPDPALPSHAADADTPRPLEIAIIGGGAAGVLVASQLLRAGHGRLRPRVIEPRERLGEGIAYATRQPAHLLNVRAGNMAAFPDEPGGFAGFAERRAGAGASLAQRYLPRAWYADYLRDTLARFAEPGSLHVRDTAVDIEGDGPYRVRLRSGEALAADAVVIATGNAPRAPLASLPGVVGAWDHDAIAATPADADVAIVGSGLSMVDAAVTLDEHGHRGRIDVYSRHGLLPLAHHAVGGPHDGGAPLPGAGVRARLREFRAEAAALQARGEPWQWVMDHLRPHGRALWQGLAPAEQARFLRHAVRYWDIHRHRIAPEIAERLDALLDSGRLRVHAARVLGVEASRGGLLLRYRRRGEDVESVQRIDRLVDATGIETRLHAMPGSLLATLAARGRVAPGPHGLGIAVGADGAVHAADGRPVPGWFAIGTPRLGTEWETTAIPDLRVQAAAIAQGLAAGR